MLTIWAIHRRLTAGVLRTSRNPRMDVGLAIMVRASRGNSTIIASPRDILRRNERGIENAPDRSQGYRGGPAERHDRLLRRLPGGRARRRQYYAARQGDGRALPAGAVHEVVFGRRAKRRDAIARGASYRRRSSLLGLRGVRNASAG